MKAIRKINNNVAICTDNNNKELIAFGKGIGFPKMPYEITDLSLIQMTFYRVDSNLYQMIEEIPDEILEVSAQIVARAKNTLNCNLNPNLVVSLADHINFAIVRLKNYKEMKIAFSFEIERLYPKETELARMAIKLIQKKLMITLPESEITNITMHFINAEEENERIDKNINSEGLIDEVTTIIEEYFRIDINRKEFIFNRFANHLRYYLNRIQNKEQFVDDVGKMMEELKNDNPRAYECSILVANYIDNKLDSKHTKDELFYLMIHINRISKKLNN